MKLFVAFTLACFVAAALLQRRDLKDSVRVLFGLVLLASIGYFFFNQI
jgi:hypothetical protein